LFAAAAAALVENPKWPAAAAGGQGIEPRTWSGRNMGGTTRDKFPKRRRLGRSCLERQTKVACRLWPKVNPQSN